MPSLKEKKLNKLRQGQEIELSFLNKLINVLNDIIDEFEDVNVKAEKSEEIYSKVNETLNNFNDTYNEQIKQIPNLNDMLAQYASLYNTIQFDDKINPNNSPLYKRRNLSFVVTNNIAPYFNGSEPLVEKTLILELGKDIIHFEYKEITINSEEDFLEKQNEHTKLFVVEDSAYVEASKYNKNNKEYYYKETLSDGKEVNDNRLWFYYDHKLYNLSSDANGNTLIQSVPTITINDKGNWVIGGEDTGKSAYGIQGDQGPEGPEGARGAKGDKGDTGMQGPQGITGNPGKTPKVLICSADDIHGSGIVLDKLEDGKKYVGFKIVYSEDSEATINTTSWKFIKVSGDTYYPHVNQEKGTLYFSKVSPTESSTQEFKIRGPEGPEGPQGKTPIIKFKKDKDIIEPELTTDEEDNQVQIFDMEDFKGDKGETGDTGPQGPKGGKGDTGSQGEQGPKGERGNVIHIGTGKAPGLITYDKIKIGDLYLDTEESDLYTCTAIDHTTQNSTWPKIGNIKGKKGDNGTSVSFKGTVDTYEDLTNLDTSNIGNGDGYIVSKDETKEGENGVLYVYNSSNGWVYCGQIQGEQGPQGMQGIPGTSGSDGKDGKDGVDAPKITGAKINEFGQLVFTFDNGTETLVEGNVVGTGITRIEKTSSSGLKDTYTIYLSNGKGETFTITNGKQGGQGIQGIPGIQGIKGDDGKDGNKIHAIAQPFSVLQNNPSIETEGSSYKNGDIGITSDACLVEAVDKQWVKKGSIKGDDGTQIYTYSGTGTPTGISNPGPEDLALSLTTFELFKLDSNGTWNSQGTLKGSKGDKGDKGDTGNITTSLIYSTNRYDDGVTTTGEIGSVIPSSNASSYYVFTVRDTADNTLSSFVVSGTAIDNTSSDYPYRYYVRGTVGGHDCEIKIYRKYKSGYDYVFYVSSIVSLKILEIRKYN